MTIVDDFYRGKEIISNIKKWTRPIFVEIDREKDIVKVGFRVGLDTEITKDEKFKILQMIEQTLLREYGESGKLRHELMKELKNLLEKIKLEIKEDLNIPIYKEVK